MKALRLVLDTNVVVSALLFPSGSLSWIRQQWHIESIVPLVSRQTVTELIRVLHYPKFRLNDADRRELLADYLPRCQTLVVVDSPTVPECRDPFDRPFLALALLGQADGLVTGDADLLALQGVFPIPIFSPAELKEQMDKNQNG